VSSLASQSLTPRQQRELEYHRSYAERFERSARAEVPFDILAPVHRRWWNAYWHAYTRLLEADPWRKRALVVWCGFGDDAVRLRRLGADVSAFDLSPESLEIAARRAARAGLDGIDFRCMPAERLAYPDGTFDLVLAVDILHHVDIPATLAELRRVTRDGALFVCNEPYTHSRLTRVRESRFVRRRLYPRVVRWMHGVADPAALYVTEDERKLDERDLAALRAALGGARVDFFNGLTGRIVPERFVWATRVDRACLRVAGSLAAGLAGRIVVSGRLRRQDAAPAAPPAPAPRAAPPGLRAA
jgi:ubiquinone/menaquinone biosynthesis C-methylase UbiE